MKAPKEQLVEPMGPTTWPEQATVAPLDSHCVSTPPQAVAAREASSSAETSNISSTAMSGDVAQHREQRFLQLAD